MGGFFLVFFVCFVLIQWSKENWLGYLSLVLNSGQNSLATHFIGFIILLKRKLSLRMLSSSDNQRFFLISKNLRSVLALDNAERSLGSRTMRLNQTG